MRKTCLAAMLLTLLFAGMPQTPMPVAGAQAPGVFDSEACRAAVDALQQHILQHSLPFTAHVLHCEQLNDWAYATAVYVDRDSGATMSAEAFLLLVRRESTALWRALLPVPDNAQEYNMWLDTMPVELIPMASRDHVRMDILPLAGASVRSVFGYSLPWADGWKGFMFDNSLHPLAVDFDLWGGDWGASKSEAGYIVAAQDGKVVYVKDVSTQPVECDGSDNDGWWFANMVVIGHGALNQTTHRYPEYSWYVHLEPHSVPDYVRPGTVIRAGEVVGQEGKTGCSWNGDTVHLHFEVSNDFPGATSQFADSIDPVTGSVLQREQHATHAPWPLQGTTINWILPSGCTLSSGTDCVSETAIQRDNSAVLYWDSDYHGPAVRYAQDNVSDRCHFDGGSGKYLCNIPSFLDERISSVQVNPQGRIFVKFHQERDGNGYSRGWWWVEANFDNDYYDADSAFGQLMRPLNDSISSLFIDCDPCSHVGSSAPGVVSVTNENLNLGSDPPMPLCGGDPPTPCVDRADFLNVESFPDGTVVQPGQSMDKWWRVKNTGTCDWSGYQLMFESGEQMGGPSPVLIPYTAPGQTAKIEVPMQAPVTPALHSGFWRIVDPSGEWVEAGRLWIKVRVQGEYESEGIRFIGAEYPDYVTPGQRFTPAVTIKVTAGRLLDKNSRGDLLRNVGDSAYGAWPHVELTRDVNTGEEYTFHFYENDPITAPDTPGTYESKWQVWQAGRFVGPVITLRFTVYEPNHPPNTPILLDPHNWWASGGTTNPPLLRAQEQGDPEGDPITHYFFEVTGPTNWNSGWIASNETTPGSLDPGNYQWRAKVRDSAGGESYWSEARNFTMDSQELTIAPLEFVPGSPSDADEVRVYTCVEGFGGIGLALKIEANTATDCSADGEWQWIEHLGTFCYNHSDSSTWPQWHTRAQPDGNHLVRATGFHNDDTVITETCYQLGYRRPSDVIPVSPLDDTWWDSRQITFRWEPSLRTDNYHLLVSTNPDPAQSPILDVSLSGDATEYTHNFDLDYQTLYWKLVASNTKGSVEMGPRQFGIDRTPPDSSVDPLDPVQYEPNFTVAWQGSDDRAGVEWYDLQYRDGARGEWTDWLTNVDLTVKMFNGQPGHRYCFRARALDNAGNLEQYPLGSGDTCTTVDVTAAPPTPWWNPGYASKRNIQILNNHTSTLPIGYPVHLHFDAGTSPTAAELYASSVSPIKGDDVRVVYDNSTELDRWIQNFSTSVIDIWFNNQVAIGGLTDNQDSHQLYYGNPSASDPPDDVGTIFHQPVDANTVGLWRFFEGTGTSLRDDSPYGNHGSFVGSPSWALDGKFGPYLSFPENNEVYVDCGNHSSLNVTSVTVEGWINFRRSSQNYGIVRKGEAHNEKFSSDNTWDMVRLMLYDQSGTGSWHLESSHFPLQEWHHFAFTYDQNTSTVRFYQDGSLTKTWVSPNGMSGPLNLNTAHLRIGGAPVYLQQIRVSSMARADFSYGRFGQTTSEPSVAAGAAQAPPASGKPDLVLSSLNAYRAGPGLEGGMIVQAVLTNDGDRATENGFFTDLYSEHLPSGAGDLDGSIHFWIANPIQPGATMTVTTLLTGTQTQLSSTRLVGSIVESSTTLYGQADSTGAVSESDDQNNISQGAEVCVATDDLHEPDNSRAEAQPILGLQTHNINTLTDEDWVHFWAEAGQTYVLATSNLGLGADTYLYLYDMDGETLLAANDDYGGTLASRILWECPDTGTYYAAVKHWNPNVSGCGTTYDLSFGEQHALFLPLALKAAGLGSASVASVQTPAPTATPTPVELATPTPSLTATATDTATASPAPTITATVSVTHTATPTSTPSPTEEQQGQPESTSPSTASPTEIAVSTPTEVPNSSTAKGIQQ